MPKKIADRRLNVRRLPPHDPMDSRTLPQLWPCLARRPLAGRHPAERAPAFVRIRGRDCRGLIVQVHWWEWLILGWSIALVWMAEAFNTALEFLADEVSLERRETLWLRPILRERVGSAARLERGVVCWLQWNRGLLLAKPIRMFGEGREVLAGRTE